MNRKEALRRVKDFVLGPEIEGTVSAVLPSQERGLISRYAIRTNNGEIIDAHISDVEPVMLFWNSFREPFRRGQEIKLRAVRARPWIDGQTVYQSSGK